MYYCTYMHTLENKAKLTHFYSLDSTQPDPIPLLTLVFTFSLKLAPFLRMVPSGRKGRKGAQG